MVTDEKKINIALYASFKLQSKRIFGRKSAHVHRLSFHGVCISVRHGSRYMHSFQD